MTSTSPLWPIAAGALLLANGVTLAALWRAQQQRAAPDTCPRCTCNTATATAAPASVITSSPSPSPSSSSAPTSLEKRVSRPTGEVFEGEHTAFPMFEPPIRRQVRRTVQCRDTFEYLHTIAEAPVAAATASASTAAGASTSAAPATAAAAGNWSGCSVISSIPDVSETGLGLVEWRRWFSSACRMIFARLPPESVCMLYQTDVLIDGLWESKAALCLQAAEAVGVRLVWHKVVVLRSVRTVRGSTAGYTHLMCFSRTHVQPVGIRTPDVLAARGPMLWARAMGLRAAVVAVDYVRQHVPTTHTLVDPFCGSGSVLALANARGLHAVGVDHARARCVQAMDLPVERVLDELTKDEGAHNAAIAELESGQVMDGRLLTSPDASAASSAVPYRTADAQALRAARHARKDARKALGISQRQQQLMERDARRAAAAEAAAAAAAQPSSST